MPNHIWERWPDEPNNWYDRFERFRLQGPTRSKLSLYNEEKGKKSKGIPNTWTAQSKRWQWEMRAEAWDEYERNRDRIEYEEDRAKARQLRQASIRALKSLGGRMIAAASEHFDPDNGNSLDIRSYKDLAQAMAVINKESRIEFGEPTDRTDITTDGKALTPSIDDMHNIFREIRALEDAMDEDEA